MPMGVAEFEVDSPKENAFNPPHQCAQRCSNGTNTAESVVLLRPAAHQSRKQTTDRIFRSVEESAIDRKISNDCASLRPVRSGGCNPEGVTSIAPGEITQPYC